MSGLWQRVTKFDQRAAALADRHYSRQTPGSRQFMPPGRTLVLIAADGLAVWGVVENLDPAGNVRWRCSIFRNESALLSSELIREATDLTYSHWAGRAPSAPLTTEVDPRKTRPKRDAGYCFIRAGWMSVRKSRGLVVFEAPPPRFFCSTSIPHAQAATGQSCGTESPHGRADRRTVSEVSV